MKHANLVNIDEARFIKASVLHTSIFPTATGRGGTIFLLSSAGKNYSEFQRFVTENIVADMEELEQGINPNVICKTRDKKPFDKNRMDNVMVFEGRRCIISNYREMVLENPTYALSIHRAKQEGEQSESFKTQYENMFLSTSSSSFFDPKSLSEQYKDIFLEENIEKYLNTPKWTIFMGFDVASTNDSSVLTIKAIESSYGQNRKSKVIALYIMNPNKNSNLDSLLNQCHAVADLVKRYKASALVVDESGIGKSATVYIKEALMRDRYYGINQGNIFPVVITSGNRNSIIEFYYNRIQSGLEMFGKFDKTWNEEEVLKALYINAKSSTSEEATNIMFMYEHLKFTRTAYKDEKSGMLKVDYRSADLKFLGDDFVLSSALCSWALSLNPAIMNLDQGISPISFNSSTGRGWGSRF